MGHTFQVFQTVLAFAAVVLLCVLLKQRGLITGEHSPLFARLLIQVALPVVIFAKLAVQPIALSQFLLVLAMMGTISACLAVSWAVGAMMKLERPQIGALMIASSFGSSTLIGYPMILYSFPHNPGAIADAILISELGVGLPLFTLCIWVAMYFGEGAPSGAGRHKIFLDYLRSPICIALAAGLLVSPLGLNPESPFLAPFFQAANMVGESIALLSCLILAIELNLRSMRGIWLLALITAAIQLGLHPWLANMQANLYHLALEPRQVLVLEAAMPSAILGVVFTTHYRCAPKMNAALVFSNVLLSIIAVPLVFALLCG
jgi:predicted permease